MFWVCAAGRLPPLSLHRGFVQRTARLVILGKKNKTNLLQLVKTGLETDWGRTTTKVKNKQGKAGNSKEGNSIIGILKLKEIRQDILSRFLRRAKIALNVRETTKY